MLHEKIVNLLCELRKLVYTKVTNRGKYKLSTTDRSKIIYDIKTRSYSLSLFIINDVVDCQSEI